MSPSPVRTCEENDAIRRAVGHDFPRSGSLHDLSYCHKCGCGASFAPTEADLDFQPCPGPLTAEQRAAAVALADRLIAELTHEEAIVERVVLLLTTFR
jgi:hypothetical protein